MKIKLLLIPAFILGSILFVSAQGVPQKPEDAVNLEALPAEGPPAETPPISKENGGGTTGKVEIKKSETGISTKEVSVPNANNDMDKNKNAVITTNKASIKSKSTK